MKCKRSGGLVYIGALVCTLITLGAASRFYDDNDANDLGV